MTGHQFTLEDRRELGRRLRAARERCGLSQGDVARLMPRMQKGHLSRYEHGHVLPTFPVVLRLARLYDLSAEEWVDMTDDLFRLEGEEDW